MTFCPKEHLFDRGSVTCRALFAKWPEILHEKLIDARNEPSWTDYVQRNLRIKMLTNLIAQPKSSSPWKHIYSRRCPRKHDRATS